MADYWSNVRYSDGGHFTLMPSLRVIPANIRINFASPETRMIVLLEAKYRIHLDNHRNVTDRRTDSRCYYGGLHCDVDADGRAVKHSIGCLELA